MMNFSAELVKRQDYINQVLEAYLPVVEGRQKTVLEAMRYSVTIGGKRLRPMMMAEVFRTFADRLEGVSKKDLNNAINDLIRETIVAHRRIIFSGNGLSGAMADLGNMFGFGGISFWSSETAYYLGSYGIMFLIAMIGATPLPKLLVQKLMQNKTGKTAAEILMPVVAVVILLVATGYLVDGSFNPFLYFRF